MFSAGECMCLGRTCSTSEKGSKFYANPNTFKKCAAGGYGSICWKDGASIGVTEVYSFGQGSQAQLGLGDSSSQKANHPVPTLITGLPSNVKECTLGRFHALCWTNDGACFYACSPSLNEPTTIQYSR